MQFYDMNSDHMRSLATIKNDWEQFRKEDPANHAGSFTSELFKIIMDTLNGRNDFQIVGPVPDEISRIVSRIRPYL